MPNSSETTIEEPIAADASPDSPPATLLRDTLQAGRDYGHSDYGKDRSILVEFVSAHPNVPLSAAHARGGVVGDIVAALLSAVGFEVQREFYANDAEDSRPLRAFGRAVFAHYKQRVAAGSGAVLPLSPDEYGGEIVGAFVSEVADRLYAEEGDRYVAEGTTVAETAFTREALRISQQEQSDALGDFGIHFDHWTRESDLTASGAVAATVGALRAAGYAHTQGGALWLQSTRLGDDADRALLRADGAASYLAADLAYHRAKFERGFTQLIDVWSADHAGYVTRTRAGLEALGFDPTCLTVVLFQSVRILKDGTAVRGSGGTAAGSASAASAVTLRELIDDIGAGSARFQLASAPPNEPIDLDLDAARRPDSPFRRVQSARNKARDLAGKLVPDDDAINPALLTHVSEEALLRVIADFPGVVKEAAREFAPHRLPAYTISLAASIEKAATQESFPIEGAAAVKSTRASLFAAAALTLDNALILIGISPTE